MALGSFQLFVSQVQTAPEELKVKVLWIIFDLLMMYDEEFFGRSEEIVGHFLHLSTTAWLTHESQAESVIAFLLHALETEESHSVQALLCNGISKLLLSASVTDERVSSLHSAILVLNWRPYFSGVVFNV